MTDEATRRPTRGVACPRCGCTHHQTLQTRASPKGSIRRRRECRACGHRFTTRETVN